jgi:C-terminal processing protease CtpA/Prc
MKMKNYFKIIFVLLFLCTLPTNAQEDVDSWPIKGENIGKGIVFKPQDYIRDELNFDNLFIKAEENSEVIAPHSGIVKSFSYVYHETLKYMMFLEHSYNDSLEISLHDAEFRENSAHKNELNPNYISISLGLEVKKGEMYYISGLRPVKYFKTGTKIKKGDIIGKVGYSYHKIERPSIQFSRSLRGRSADPMSIFGLTSSFLPPQKSTRNYLTYKHPVKKLIEDFNVFKDALEEGHPGLYDYVSKDQLNKLFDLVEAKLIKPMTSEEFRVLLLPILKEVRDSHTGLISKRYKTNDRSTPPILFGLKNDSLVVFSTITEHSGLVGKNIVEIDGEKVINIIPKVKLLSYGNDGYITTLENRWLLLYFWKYYSQLKSKKKGDEVSIKFSDGSSHTFKYQLRKLDEYYPKLNRRTSNRFSLSMITSQTARLNINTFDLLEKDIDSIGNFIKNISDSSCQNLIIDVRDNSGGKSENINKIYSFIANKPFRVTHHQKVNSNTTYPFLKNSMNYVPDQVLYEEYKEVEGKDGFYLTKEYFPQINPDEKIHFDGNVYVLVNEISRSAATVFPALVRKHKRGLVVGRETGGSYYQLNAMDFAEVFLKNTGLELINPLVKVVFDEIENKEIPWGRGVIPDYEVKLDYKEFLNDEDPILKTTINLIDKLENPESKEGKKTSYMYLLIGIVVVTGIGIPIYKKTLAKNV